MAHGPEPHPDTDTRGDTIEFAAIEQEQPERVCYELTDGVGVRLAFNFQSPVEIRAGLTTESSPLFLHRGEDWESLCGAVGTESFSPYVLIQPDVMAENPKRGWLVIDKFQPIGREITPQFRLGRDVRREEHFYLGPSEYPVSLTFEIIGASKNPTRVLVDRNDAPLRYYDLDAN